MATVHPSQPRVVLVAPEVMMGMIQACFATCRPPSMLLHALPLMKSAVDNSQRRELPLTAQQLASSTSIVLVVVNTSRRFFSIFFRSPIFAIPCEGADVGQCPAPSHFSSPCESIK